jgi:adenine-specific DNA methylase
VVLVERVRGRERELAPPTIEEIAQASDAAWEPTVELGLIPEGQETAVLRRHGFERWEDIYPKRQRVIVQRLLSLAAKASDDPAVVEAMRLAIIGSTEMAGLLSRWDRYYLKSYEAMAGHRFNFTTFAVEPNVLGTDVAGRGSVTRRLASFAKAAAWLRERAGKVTVEGPILITGRRRRALGATVDVRVVEGSSERMLVPGGSVDLVLTDPPYHDDVQYDELSLPLRAWAGQSLEQLAGEAVVNASTGTNAQLNEYRSLLTRIFRETRRALKPDGHLIFSYANRVPAAWSAVLDALQDAGFQALGYAVLHSENEMDVAKRGVRACTMDLLMDLVPSGCGVLETWVPHGVPSTPEGYFLQVVASTFMKVGKLARSDLSDFEEQLAASVFLAETTRSSRPGRPRTSGRATLRGAVTRNVPVDGEGLVELMGIQESHGTRDATCGARWRHAGT